MKKIAILVIAAVNQPLYIHYIRTYWTALISYLKVESPHIDVFLLFERGTNINEYKNIEDNIIVDVNDDFDLLCDPEYCSIMIPGILSKTIYALELLHDKYDVFFRTNLSSLINVSAFDGFVQSSKSICYSGTWVWTDGLRKDLLYHDKIGPNMSIKTLSELDNYEGNTFVSGSGFFLNSKEAESLVRRKDTIRYDIIDDVSIGLMFTEHEQLPGFSTCITADIPFDKIIDIIRKTKACHIRLEHFPLDLAEVLWLQLSYDRIWR
jgi:hypothetical protein